MAAASVRRHLAASREAFSNAPICLFSINNFRTSGSDELGLFFQIVRRVVCTCGSQHRDVSVLTCFTVPFSHALWCACAAWVRFFKSPFARHLLPRQHLATCPQSGLYHNISYMSRGVPLFPRRQAKALLNGQAGSILRNSSGVRTWEWVALRACGPGHVLLGRNPMPSFGGASLRPAVPAGRQAA